MRRLLRCRRGLRGAGAVLVICLGIASRAESQQPTGDTFGNGDGHWGAFSAPEGLSHINSYTRLAIDAPAGTASITVGDATSLAAGDLLMLWQPNGLTGVDAGATPPIDLSGTNVGRYELARLIAISGATLTLAAPLQNSFPAAWTQIVRVPEFTTVSVPTGSVLSPNRWDGSTGGILAFLATGEVSVDGAISATSLGFRGGVTTVSCPRFALAPDGEGLANSLADGLLGPTAIANAGGGSVCNSGVGLTPAGGGGNAGAGGAGQAASEGGNAVAYPLTQRLLFGGGGGGAGLGLGQSGGGVLFIRAHDLVGSGTVTANGGAGSAGGGAGGTVYVALQGGSSICSGMQANGGTPQFNGSNGGGGGGGGGYVFLQTTAACQPVAAGGRGLGPGATTGAAGLVDVVTIPNHAPTLSAGPDQNLTVCSSCFVPVTLTPSVVNPDNDSLTFAWTEGTTALASTLAATVLLPAGTHTLQLTATDLTQSLTVSATVVVTITAVDLNALQQQVTTLGGLVTALTNANNALASQLTTANQTIATLTTQLTAANQTVAALQAQIASLQQQLRSALGDPTFTVPGSTPQQQVQNLVTAIGNLNPGQKLALYKNLGGKK